MALPKNTADHICQPNRVTAMGFRFSRRIKIAPGLSLNLSKSGVSTSVRLGGITVNSRGRVTVGAHGTGMSVSHDFAAEERKAQREAAQERRRAEREIEMSFPTINQQIKQLKKTLVGHDCMGDTLWHQGGVGLVGVLLDHEATPREVREHCAAIQSWDRIEVQVLRCESRQQANAVALSLLESIQAVLAFAREVGILEDDA